MTELTIKIKQNVKPVAYLGNVLYVPKWTEWLAIDECGIITAYKFKPSLDLKTGFWAYSGQEYQILHVEMKDCPKWSDTLRKV